jgi:hypothetical protein
MKKIGAGLLSAFLVLSGGCATTAGASVGHTIGSAVGYTIDTAFGLASAGVGFAYKTVSKQLQKKKDENKGQPES